MIAAPSAEERPLLRAALDYAARGWPVFPLRPKDKRPIHQGGFKIASRDADAIRGWWGRVPEPNLGVPCGSASGFWVLDVDSAKGGDDSLRDLIAANGPLPETAEALTGGGGRHLLFRFDPARPVRNSARRLGAGLDVRGEGGYIVAPPSVHPSGRSYEWEVTHDPADVPIADPPEWLLGRVTESSKGADLGEGEPVDVEGGPIREGERNEVLFREGCRLRRAGFSDAAIHARLQRINAARCRPPLPDTEVAKIAASVSAYKPSCDRPARRPSPPFIKSEKRTVDAPWFKATRATLPSAKPGTIRAAMTFLREWAWNDSPRREWGDVTDLVHNISEAAKAMQVDRKTAATLIGAWKATGTVVRGRFDYDPCGKVCGFFPAPDGEYYALAEWREFAGQMFADRCERAERTRKHRERRRRERS